VSRSRPSAHPAALLAAALVAIVVQPAPVAAQYRNFGKNKVQYQEFEWKIYHSPHFDVYYYTAEENLLEKVVSFAESAYDQLSRAFDYQIQQPTPLIFYATHSAFEQNNVILNFIPEGVGAFASPARNRMVMPVDVPDPELAALIRHELTHIFQYHILFQGSLSKAATLRPPTWFMEGMASYMAKDEKAYDKMVLRDAVVNDIIPSVAQGDVEGYFAYRIGHAVFDYIEERWGQEGVRDFLYEMRNTIGTRPGRALQRTFRIDPEDFDTDFRRWLRKKYLRALVETGEPSDFGRPFRVENHPETDEISPVSSPSGDLVAALSVQHGDLDVVLFDGTKRRQIRNLTRGLTTRYQYLVAQGLTVGRRIGRDLAFSPDGNYLAAFAHREGGRCLVLIDVLNGGVSRIVDMADVEQQISLAWSPDGRTIAFAGNHSGQFDIYLLDLETEKVSKVTDDPVFDGAPAFSPDGKSLVFSSVVGESTHIFRVELADPGKRYQITQGESNDTDAVYSPDGRRIYFTSDRNGYDNIYGLDLESGELRQYTDVVTGCFMPEVVPRPDGGDDLVYTGYWKGSYKLYLNPLEEPVAKPEVVAVNTTPASPEELPRFEPAIEVSVDPANKEKYGGFKFFLEDAQTYIAVDSNQTYLGQVALSFSDYLGNKRIIAILSSYDALSNFNVQYWNLGHRTQLGLELFDYRDFFYVLRDPVTGQILDRRNEIRQTGALALMAHPFGFSTRFEAGIGYIFRHIDQNVTRFDPTVGFFQTNVGFSDDFPWIEAALVGDSALYSPWGPVTGRRWRLDANWAPKLNGGGTVTSEISGDFRQYVPTTLRSGFAFRLFAGARFGDQPSPFYVGGDNIRSIRFRGLSGDRAAFTNIEYRFPLIDVLATPFLRFQGIRGRVFLDVAAVYYQDLGFLLPQGGLQVGDFTFYRDGRLQDGLAVYGFGFTVRFLGLDLNWDFGKRWDFKETLSSGYTTTFYIGTRF
jgi:sugar lactone lactonase YvrE